MMVYFLAFELFG